MAQINAGVGVLFAWCGNTFPSPPAKRAVALALINAAGGLLSVPSAYVPYNILSFHCTKDLIYLLA